MVEKMLNFLVFTIIGSDEKKKKANKPSTEKKS